MPSWSPVEARRETCGVHSITQPNRRRHVAFKPTTIGLRPVSTALGQVIRIRTTAVVAYSAFLVSIAVAALMYPVIKVFWSDFQEKRAIDRDFVLATESEQVMIVRSYLERQLKDEALCGIGGCPPKSLYFDRSAAVLLPIESPEPWEKFETRSAFSDRSLFDRPFTTVPIPLQELLDESTKYRSENVDPRIPGIVYVDDPENLPELGDREICRSGTRLVRISRAAIHQPGDMAVALIETTYCDKSQGTYVAQFKRSGNEWSEEIVQRYGY